MYQVIQCQCQREKVTVYQVIQCVRSYNVSRHTVCQTIQVVQCVRSKGSGYNVSDQREQQETRLTFVEKNHN